jgi:hypothetical protein
MIMSKVIVNGNGHLRRKELREANTSFKARDDFFKKMGGEGEKGAYAKCPKCKCEFEFYRTDVVITSRVVSDDISPFSAYVPCAQCAAIIKGDNTVEVEEVKRVAIKIPASAHFLFSGTQINTERLQALQTQMS